MLLGCSQVLTCAIITIAYSCNNVRTSVGLYAIMTHIFRVGAVTLTAPIDLQMRGFGAVGMCLGTLLCGFRLVPVTGTISLPPPPPPTGPTYRLVSTPCLQWLVQRGSLREPSALLCFDCASAIAALV